MIEGRIACANKAASFNNVMSIVESRGGEILVNRMYFEAFEGMNGRESMLPNVSNDIVKTGFLEHVNWVGRDPVF